MLIALLCISGVKLRAVVMSAAVVSEVGVYYLC